MYATKILLIYLLVTKVPKFHSIKQLLVRSMSTEVATFFSLIYWVAGETSPQTQTQ